VVTAVTVVDILACDLRVGIAPRPHTNYGKPAGGNRARPDAGGRATGDDLSKRRFAMTVEDVMTKEVITVRPETPLKEVARTLALNEISGVPVTDAGVVIGVVSETDLIRGEAPAETRGRSRHLFAHEPDGDEPRGLARTAGEAMTTPPLTIEGRETLEAAATLMSARDINRLPVVDDRGLAGIVTRADLVRALARSDEEIHADVVRTLRSEWIPPETVTVEVTAGKVFLSGEVTLPKAVQTVVPAVEAIPGVVSVHSGLVEGSYDDGRPGFARRTAKRLSGMTSPTTN
jgi:CBS domain-containing protein